MEARGVVLIAAVVVVPAWLLVGHRRRLGTVVAWLVAVQFAAHLTLGALCSDGAGRSVPLSVLAAHSGAVLATAVALQHADAQLWSSPTLASGLRGLLSRTAQLLTAEPAPSGGVERSHVPVESGQSPTSRQTPPPSRRGPPRRQLRPA